MPHPDHNRSLDDLRTQLARIERAGRPRKALPFGVAVIDAHLPHRGLECGRLHEVAAAGPELTHAAAAGLFVGGILGRLKGPVLWCLRSRDLFAPALASVGLTPERLLFVETRIGDSGVLIVVEEGLQHRCLAAVVGEVGRLTLAEARRLQLAAEKSGVTVLVLRRWTEAGCAEPTAAVTRWRIGALPSTPLPTAGVGRPRWRVELTRCREGRPAEWILEACDETGCLGVPADLVHGSPEAGRPRRAARQ